MAGIKINLNKYTTSAFSARNQHNWPLSITAEGVNISSDIFVFQYIPGEGDVFRNVASVHDMNELPVDASGGFYRSSNVEFSCRNPEEVEVLWERIKEDTQDLIENYNLSLRLGFNKRTEVEIAENETISTVTEYVTPLISDTIQEIITLEPRHIEGLLYNPTQPNATDAITAMYNIAFNFDSDGWIPVTIGESVMLPGGTIEANYPLTAELDYTYINDVTTQALTKYKITGQYEELVPVFFYNVSSHPELLTALRNPKLQSVNILIDGRIDLVYIHNVGINIVWFHYVEDNRVPENYNLYSTPMPFGTKDQDLSDYIDYNNQGSNLRDIKLIMTYAR